MEVAGAIVGLVCSSTVELIDPFSYKRSVGDLLIRVDRLFLLKMDLKDKLDAANRNGYVISPTFSHWLDRVDMVMADAEKLSFQVDEITSCFKGWCCGRYNLGRKARKLRYKVDKLFEETPMQVAFHLPLQNFNIERGKDFAADKLFNKEPMLKVMEALHDKISIIGVVGIPGIGKTTLMKMIAIQVKEEKLFNSVIMVSVSQNQNLRRIQDDIAAQLSFEFEPERRDSRARKLYTKLMQEKTVLIILDDLWMELDLIEVGIPVEKFHPGCKVVLTTRNNEVLKAMNVQATIILECLSDDDSWNLFEKCVGINLDTFSSYDVARQVAKECGGIPLLLTTVGKALRGRDRQTWVHMLYQLQRSQIERPPYFELVFDVMKLSYDNLPSKNMKFVFLYCCIFSENHQIGTDELLRCLVGEGIFEDADFDQAERNLREMIDSLISSSLLLKGDLDGFFMMHDVVRDVAKKIASVENGFVVKTGKGYNMWPSKEALQNCLRLSLMESDISELPEQPECPSIKTLTLSRCYSLKIIPDSFFEGMKSLVNLDLSHTPIVALPSSIKCLENLRTLCLDGCSSLKDISVIEKLKTLEIISLKKISTVKLSARELREFPNLKLIAMEN